MLTTEKRFHHLGVDGETLHVNVLWISGPQSGVLIDLDFIDNSVHVEPDQIAAAA